MGICFEFTPEQDQLRKTIREFGENKIKPLIPQIESQDRLPPQLIQDICKPPLNLVGLGIPKEYGGKSGGLIDVCIAVEELAYYNPACSVLLELAELMYGMLRFGSEQLRSNYLRKLASGEMIGAIAMTERGCGSDAAAITTSAKLVGDHYVINGHKWFVSFADIADFFMVTVKHIGEGGISLILVEKDLPGVKIKSHLPHVGMRGHRAYELVFEDCRVPASNLVGEPGKGLRYALSSLNRGRVSLAAGYLGLARAALDTAIEFSRSRMAFGNPISEYQAIRFPIAETMARLEAARWLVYYAAWLHDQSKDFIKYSALAKALASQVMLDSAQLCSRVMGGYGCLEGFGAERFCRDAITWVAAQGTPEILKLTGSRYIFG